MKSVDEGQPNRIAYSIRPEFNSLVFFPVGNSTYHQVNFVRIELIRESSSSERFVPFQVSEVLTDETPRITINGWFHSKEALNIEPLPYREATIPFVETHDKGVSKITAVKYPLDKMRSLIFQNLISGSNVPTTFYT